VSVSYYFPSSCCNLIHIRTEGTPTSCVRRPCFLCRVDHVRKIRDRKQSTGIGKYSFVNKEGNVILLQAWCGPECG